jgi:TRAP-type uncharacterized transport system fused permease subunit
VYVAAGIANADWLKTAWVAIRLAIVKYILPFMFILNTSLLMLGPTSGIIWSVAAATAGVYMIAAGTMGYLLEDLGMPARLVLIVASLLCFTCNFIYVFIGLAMGGGVYAYQYIDRKKLHGNIKTA